MEDQTPRKPIYDKQKEAIKAVMYGFFAECIMPDLEHEGVSIFAAWVDDKGELQRNHIYTGPRHVELLALAESYRQEMFDDWAAEEAARK